MKDEDFVTYEQAVKLKELGFNGYCNHYYHVNTKEFLPIQWLDCDGDVSADDLYDNNPPNVVITEKIMAPTLSQATKWLRSKNIEVLSYYDYTTKTWIFEVCEIGEPHSCGYHSDDFDLNKLTYEEAISTGIDKALEIYFDK